MSVMFMVTGNLSEFVTLGQTYAEFSSSEDSKSFTYTVDLPEKIIAPGNHEIKIIALEMPKDIKEKGTFVGATISVATQLHVYVPYPYKYAEAEVNVIESEGQIVFLIPVVNRGKLGIVDLRAVVDIYDGTETKIATIESNTDSLESLERKELLAKWEANVNPGRYKAIVTVRYDYELITVLKEFNVGEMFLEIQEIVIKDFELGGIAKFDALVENKWSSNLKDVYLNIIVYNHEGEIMADFKSPDYDIPSLSKKEITAYWDTAGVEKGTYDEKIILKYGEKSTEKNTQMKITENEIEIIGLTGRVIVQGKGTFNLNNILIILVVFLILVNIVWFAVVKKLLKRKKGIN